MKMAIVELMLLAVALARYLDEDSLDMIVGGHSQEPVCMEGPNVVKKHYKPSEECKPDMQNGTYIVQAHEWGKYVGRADYEFKNGELRTVSYDLIPVNLKKKVKVNGKKQRVLIEKEIPEDQSYRASYGLIKKKVMLNSILKLPT